jgi:hypothetical protein
MKELNTKIGVFLTTYTQQEIDENIDLENYAVFMDDIKSFNPKSRYSINKKQAIKLIGIEVKKSKSNPHNLYTNYKGNPFGLPVEEAKLYYTDPLSSLKSAFEITAPNFDFDKDFFHIRIVK